MKFLAILLAATAVASPAVASPTERVKRSCGSPGTYQCAPSLATMQVCDWDGNWKDLDPGCPSGTACEEDPFGTGIPYCMATQTPPSGTQGGTCSTPGQYSCFTDGSGQEGIQICDLSSQLQVVGMCPNYCAPIGGIPYCF